MSEPDQVLLVDGDNILVRAVMATEGSGMSSADGIETGPLLIFINTLSRYVRDVKPTRMVVCWDHGPCHWRIKLHPGYKANRAEHTEEHSSRRGNARALARRFLSLAGVHHADRPGWEADDLIGAYWRKHKWGAMKWILSSDKDLLQLLDVTTRQIRVSSADTPTDFWDPVRVHQKYGCVPGDLSKAMALIGDVSDGIPGVHGIGPKTAVKLLEQADWDLARIEDPRVVEKAAEVAIWHKLIDLRMESQESHQPLVLPQAPYFRPTKPGMSGYDDLVQFLESFAMSSVLTRLHESSLWG
jgi:5'-3' exonuclease